MNKDLRRALVIKYQASHLELDIIGERRDVHIYVRGALRRTY